ncbi:hypothetical protein CN138_09160 [Sinorhizobium meliloti]|uniref:hypothetical protein n=1 Tax=Rhizobium meliloti TaxID=382 RepID=UPI000FD1D285|nr:hypothetical protein [Sinorhizobium meliloti]RVL48487.1 hypothetical protein CN145_23285 [Sinorhizobium meliloti]RVL72420.1 hypothetical protein CN138_09160 [Sinorhizobium meliloti]
MPTFQITGPDGKKYRVKGENAEGAFKALQQHIGAPPPVQESQASVDTRNDLSAMTQGMTGELPGGNLAAARYEGMPWRQQAAQAADDTMRLMANGITFGYADKIAGALGGEGTDAERAKSDEARNRAGSAGTAAELVGAVTAPVGLARQGVTLAGRLGTGAMTGAKGLAARSALMGVEGAGYGALTAAGNDQGISEGAGYGAAGGILGNVAGEAISAGVGKLAGAFNKKPAIPQLDEIEEAKNAAYQRAEQAGVAYTPAAIDRINGSVANGLSELGYDPALMPGARVAIDRLQELQGQNVTLKGLDTVRKIANQGNLPPNAPNAKANNAAVGKIVSAIDDLIENAGQGEILMGDAVAGEQAIREARSLAARGIKANKIEDAVRNAEIDAAASGSGGNVDNRTRQMLKPLLKNPRGFTPDEQSALNTAVRGTPTQNALRLAGKLSPSGNGLMAILHLLGGSATGGATLPLAAGGMAAKALSDRTTSQNTKKLIEVILAGGDASATKAAPNAVQRLAQSKREALARILMSIGAHEAGTP